jgi:hypothetical protein
MATLVIHDETTTGRPVSTMTLPDLPSTITVRELVRLRVREEVARHNAAPAEVFSGLVKPTDAEVAVNGYRLKTARRLDWEKQAEVAEEAFSRNGYFILVGDRQVEDLDEVVDLDADPHVAFVKLTPLVGG